MQERFTIWLSLFACLTVIGMAGVRPSLYGPIIAEKSGLSRGWVGLILLATVTSLPERVTGVSAVTVANLPDVAVCDIMGAVDLAIGNLFGSNLFSIAILAIDDLFYLPGPLLADVSMIHDTSVFSAMMMSGLAGVGLVLRRVSRVFGTVSWVSLLLVISLLNTWFLYPHG